METLRRIFAKLESAPMSFQGGLFAFVGIIVIKAILENFANGTFDGFFTAGLEPLLHYFVWFSGSYLTLCIIVHLVTKRDLAKVSKLLLFAHVLIWATALIDLAAFRGLGHRLSYVYLGASGLIRSFFAAGYDYNGVGLGQNVVIPAIALIIVFYSLSVTGKWVKALLSGLLSYLAIFVWGSFPSIFKIGYDLLHGRLIFNEQASAVTRFFVEAGENSVVALNLIPPQTQLIGSRLHEVVQVGLFSQLFFVPAALAFAVWAYLINRRRFRLVVGNIRLFGVVHYYLNIAIGLLLATASPLLNANWTLWLSGLLLFFAYYCAYMHALGVNDITDLPIDQVSNADRPLAGNRLSQEELNDYNLGFLVLALIASYLSGAVIFYTVLVAVMASSVYSRYPLRLKRVPFVATFLIALASLAAILGGFYFLNFTKAISAFPPRLLGAVLLFHVLWGNVKDLKDREGDRAGGVLTLANLGSIGISRKLVAVLAAIAYLLVPWILGVPPLVLVSLAAAGLTAFLIVRGRNSHYPLFFVYYLYTLAAIVIVSLASR